MSDLAESGSVIGTDEEQSVVEGSGDVVEEGEQEVVVAPEVLVEMQLVRDP